VAQLLGVPADCVGLKAKTPEGLNLDNAAVAHVVVLLEKRGDSKKARKKTKTRKRAKKTK
jgi:2-C-methyl-D-erythritol 2,4-cyclodiphosphate synthase